VSRAGRRNDRAVGEQIATDLVQYLIVSMPDLGALATLAPVLTGLVDAGTLRILDAVVISRDREGVVELAEPETVPGMTELADACVLLGELLTDRDIELASVTVVTPGAAVVLVAEDRWAGPLADATSSAGGQIVAGEHIPAQRVEAVLAEARAATGQED
jgi:hypothetical protein